VTHTCHCEPASEEVSGSKRRRNRPFSFLGALEVVGWTCAAAGVAGLSLWPDTLDSIVAPQTLVRNYSAGGNAPTKKEPLIHLATLPAGGLGHPATTSVVQERSSTPAIDILETASHSPAAAATLPASAEPTEMHLIPQVDVVSEKIAEASASTEQADLDSWIVPHLASLREEAPRDFPLAEEDTVEARQESASKSEDERDLPIKSAENLDAIQVSSQSPDGGGGKPSLGRDPETVQFGTSHTSAPWSHAIRNASEIDSLIARGEQLLVRGDLASARLFFRRAADAGDVRGAAGMARSFDQKTLRTLPIFGARPDPGQAAIWHTRANELGRIVAGH
jgi:hypothetical protein